MTQVDYISPQKGGVCVIAGEASGDMQGQLLLKALYNPLSDKYFVNNKLPKGFFWGVTGNRLRELDVDSIHNLENLTTFGFIGPFRSYCTHSECRKKILFEFDYRRPIAVILINYSHFNLRIAEDAYLRNIKVVFHIPPQIWARKGLSRISKLKKFANLITCILPFEKDFYKQHDLSVKFIGNPLFDAINNYKQKNKISKDYHLTSFKIGLLPGSRKSEIEAHLPIMIEAFDKLCQTFPDIIGYVPIASSLEPQFVQNTLKKTYEKLDKQYLYEKIIICFDHDSNYKVMQNIHYAWVCSGTATLETAFFQTPMSVVYKTSYLNEFIAKKVLNIKYLSLVNLCLNHEVVPEFIQHKASAQNLYIHAKTILTDEFERKEMITNLLELSTMMPSHSTLIAAKEISKIL